MECNLPDLKYLNQLILQNDICSAHYQPMAHIASIVEFIPSPAMMRLGSIYLQATVATWSAGQCLHYGQH
jgi:hypothetical protein